MQHNISPKVAASTIASAITVIAWALASVAGINVPVEVQAAGVVIVTFLAGYLKVDPDRVA